MIDYDYAAIDEILASRVRLAIIAFLAGAKTADFAAVRDATKTTDGNASVVNLKLITQLQGERGLSTRKSV